MCLSWDSTLRDTSICVCVYVSVGGPPQVNKRGEGPKVSVVGGGVPGPTTGERALYSVQKKNYG